MTRSMTLGLLVALAAPALAWPADTVVFRDPKTGAEQTKNGAVVSETPDVVQIKLGAAGTLDVSVKDLISVTHGDAPSEYKQAESAKQQGDYTLAADLYKKSLDAKNVGPWLQQDARFYRADCFYHLGNLKDASAVLAEMLADPKAANSRFHALALVRQAQCQLYQGAFDQAKATLEGLRSAATSWGDVAREFWEARVLEARKDYPQALQGYMLVASRAGQQFPEIKAMALARIALCNLAQGKAQEARASLDQDKLVEDASAEKAGGAALRNASGAVYLALAREATDKEKAKKLAFSGLWDFLKVVVQGEEFAEEHAAAYDGASQCFSVLGDARSKQMTEERRGFYKDAFSSP